MKTKALQSWEGDRCVGRSPFSSTTVFLFLVITDQVHSDQISEGPDENRTGATAKVKCN